jgi:hypothetical protein
MEKIAALDTGESLFFSHYDPQTVEYIYEKTLPEGEICNKIETVSPLVYAG